MKNSRGFTLIELMIVVAIIAILVAVALPSYQQSVMRGKRADAQGALLGFASAMERHYTENNTYCDAGTTVSNNCGEAATGDTGTPTIFAATVPLDGGIAYYALTISAVTNNSYTLTATPTGSMTGDTVCANLTLDNRGVQGISGTGGINDCWR